MSLPGGITVTCLEVRDVDIVLDRAIEEGTPPPYGAVLWASGIALSLRLVERAAPSGRLEGMRVVDVGSGVGLCSLVAARLGAEVLALDHDAVARELLVQAAEQQGLQVSARDFDIYGDEPLPAGELTLFADLLYETPLARATARRVLEVLRGGSDVMVGDPQRIGREDFLRDLNAAGQRGAFEDTIVDVPGDEQRQRVGVLSLRGEPS